jgi:long-chain fatty acid transport protein
MKKNQAILLAVAALASGNAFAGGFEKNVTWSGKYVGIGGAAVSRVEGSESLYFNPAGLASKRGENGDVTLNFSPTFAKFKGSFVPGRQEESDKSFIPVGGATASYQIMDRLSVGVGYYVSGGTSATYENVALTGFTITPELKSELALTELAVGLGYEVLPGLRIGAAWRMLNVSGDFFFANVTGNPLTSSYSKIEDIKDTKYNGFKVGAQYQNADKTWGVGVMFRNGVNFNADMRRSVYTVAGTAVPGVPAADGTIRSSFPWQASVGANYSITEAWHLHGEFTHTDYNHNGKIDYTGTGAVSIPLAWKDQQNYRLGVEYTGFENLALRAGYVFTSQVVPNGNANPTFSTPGNGHTVTIGAGRSFLEGNVLDVNIAAEHSWATSDNLAAVAANLPATSGVAGGEYSSSSWAAHLGAAYKF